MYFTLMWRPIDETDTEEVELLVKSLLDSQPFVQVYDVFETPQNDDRISGGVVLFNVDRPGSPSTVDRLGDLLRAQATNKFSFVITRANRGVTLLHSADLDSNRLRTICNFEQ